MKRPRLIPPSYFLWLPLAAGLYGVYALYGLPHVIWSYSFVLEGDGDRWDFSARYYTRCVYVGPAGPFARDADDGRCAWFALRHASNAGGAQ